MTTKISDTEMTSDLTRHTARAADGGGWTVSWLPGRTLTQNQAITAMTIAETVVDHADDLADNDSVWWLHIDQWAAELGITGPQAVAHAALSPEDHADMPRVRVILPEPGPVGYLLALDRAAGKATVRIDGATVTMDAGRLQYCAPGAAPEDGDVVWTAPAEASDNEPPNPTSPERPDLINVMAPDETKALLACIAGYAPEVFDHALVDRSESFADELFGRIEERDAAEYMAEPEGYCLECGANVSWFIGYDGPQHFRGPHKLVTGSEHRELFEADHAPAVAWRDVQRGSR